MFNEHTLDAGVTAMKKQGLVQGRMLEMFSDLSDVVVGTVESGEFWYGDLEMGDLSKLHIVAKEIGESIRIYRYDGEPLTISI